MGFSHFSLANFTSDLEKGIAQNRHLLLCAPTGSGKSLFFPYFLSKRFSGKIIILEPRRLAAQELGWLPDCKQVFAIPVSASSKNPYFDRKPKEQKPQ